MLFNSYIFILLFLPLTLLGYYLLNHYKQYRLATVLLVGMSLWFYGYNNVWYLPLLIGSIGLNYLVSYGLSHAQKQSGRKLLLWGGILVNIGTLFFFKYYSFTASVINDALGTDFVLHHLILPLGISFYTFQQLSYVIDLYKKEAPLYPLLDYAVYVTFFPQLIAGPIVLHEELIPQFRDESRRRINPENFVRGIYAFSLGLGKKVLLADVFSKVVMLGYADIASLDTTNAFVVMLSYTLQLYFDFSGYCDMAFGIGYMFNIEIPQNFDSPYKASNLSDFWKRWHITLSRFFTRYIYYPLGGNRKGKVRGYINLFLVFFVSAIWHGAGWTYIVWGVLCGGSVVFDKLLQKYLHRIWKPLGTFLTYAYFIFTLIVFRAPTMGDAMTMFHNFGKLSFGPVNAAFTETINSLAEVSILSNLGLSGVLASYPFLPLVLLLAFGQFLVWGCKNTQQKVKAYALSKRALISSIVLLIWSLMSLTEISEFLYFNF